MVVPQQQVAAADLDAVLVEVIRGGASLLAPDAGGHRALLHRSVAERGPARECGDLVRAYTDLGERVRKLPRTAFGDHVDRLLSCQLEIASNAANLAFRVHDGNWPALAARFGDGTAAGDALLYLAAEVSRH